MLKAFATFFLILAVLVMAMYSIYQAASISGVLLQ